MPPNPPDLATALRPEAPAAGENSRAATSCTIVIFGASGDLTKRKLIPALYEIASQKPAPRFAVIGFARTPTSDDAFRKTAAEAAGKNGSSVSGGGLAGGSTGGSAGARGDEKGGDEKLRDFAQSFTYVAGEYDQPDAYQNLSRKLEEVDRERQLGGNRLFYLATPPAVYPQVIEQIRKAGLAQPKGNSW